MRVLLGCNSAYADCSVTGFTGCNECRCTRMSSVLRDRLPMLTNVFDELMLLSLEGRISKALRRTVTANSHVVRRESSGIVLHVSIRG